MNYALAKVKCPPVYKPKCDVCGKYRKWKSLTLRHTPDSWYGAEENYFECKFCIQKTEKKSNHK